MYEIRVNDEPIYYAGDAECTITAGKLKQTLNEAGSLEITIPSINPFYDRLKQRNTELTVYQDNNIVWNGEVREIGTDFYKNKNVYAVGEMSYLMDSIQPLKQYASTSKAVIFNEIIKEHNSQVEERKRFEVGAIGIPDGLFTMVTDWENTLDFIRSNLLENDDCIRIRRANGKRYIDLMPLDAYGVKSEQSIEFGGNLLDLAMSGSTEDLCTAVIPLGAAKDESSIEDYEDNITIESVNDGKNYIYSEQAVSNYGWIKEVVNFDEITNPTELKEKAIEWLQSKQYEKFTYKLSAVDMSMIDASIDRYSVGDLIRCISEPHDMDVWLPVRSREIDLLNLANNKISLGAEVQKSLTQKTYASVRELEQKMPEETSILKAARNNASSLINSNGTKGNVSIKIDEKGKPYEIDIMDADSFEQSTNIWRWNLSGFGHGTKEAGINQESEVDWNADVAITMDGSINANFVTVGAMLADMVKGGTLEVGGNGLAKDGSIKVYNSSGNLIGSWDSNGINVYAGSISGARINAQSGNIAQFSINANGYSGLENPNNGLHLPWSSSKAIYIGSYSDPDIELNENGRIYCNDLRIDGYERLSKYLDWIEDEW